MAGVGTVFLFTGTLNDLEVIGIITAKNSVPPRLSASASINAANKGARKMFHWKDNIYWGRREDGSVRVFQLTSPPKGSGPYADGPTLNFIEAVFDLSIPADIWASIVASVSAGGEGDERFFSARAFHYSAGVVHIMGEGKPHDG